MSENKLQMVIERINSVYRKWNRQTSLQQMRSDWEDLYRADNTDTRMTNFSLGEISCRWTASDTPGDNVILYIHGGGFRLGSIDSHQRLVSELAKTCNCRVLSFNYRLMPEHIFPAQLDDTAGVYQWLVEQGTDPRHIVIAGDSAGANLAAALIQRLHQQRQLLPCAMVLLSPWLDMTLSGDSYESRASLDPVHQKNMLNALATEYLGDAVDRQSPLVSPLFGDLFDLPPTLIHFGGREVGLDDGVEYQRRAVAAGSDVTLDIWPDMIHVFHSFVDELPEAVAAIRKIADFIDAAQQGTR